MLGLSQPQDAFESLSNGFVYGHSAFEGEIETDLNCTDMYESTYFCQGLTVVQFSQTPYLIMLGDKRKLLFYAFTQELNGFLLL